ncbi:MAG TPA: hypothetical protein VGJ04_05805 [Pirellulales bacterium]|jgi:hypothetical protein
MLRRSTWLAFAILAAATLTNTGCFWIATDGPNLGPLAIPIPVSPYLQKEQEDRYWVHLRYERVPILGPITAGGPVHALDPPSDDEVIRALEKARPIQGGVSLLHEEQRNNVRIVKEKIADYVDPPRFYPLLGPAQLHHAHYKCTAYFTNIVRVGWPVPYTKIDEDASEVLYIDHNHFHVVGNVDFGPTNGY